MKLSKIIGAILIVISLGIGWIGISTINENTKKISILGLELEASDESGKQQGYIYLGLGVLLFVGGIYMVTRSKKW